MAKILRVLVPVILVIGACAVFSQTKGSAGKAAARRDAGVVTRDGGIALDAGVRADGGVVKDAGAAVPDGGSSKGDAGQPSLIPACGNCTYDPATGVLNVQAMQPQGTEPPLPWVVVSAEVVYQNGTIANPLAAVGSVLNGTEVNCNFTKTFSLATAQTANIKSINLRLKSQANQVLFKRNCVKLSSNGTITILDHDCRCCSCAVCTDVGTCQP